MKNKFTPEERKIDEFYGESITHKLIAMQQKLNQEFNWRLNAQLYGDKPRKLNWWQKIKMEFRYQIANFRVRLGEWIAGTQLYE